MDMSILKTIALLVEKFAPTVADVLTGGATSKIGIVLEMLANLFGANSQDPNDVLQKIGDAQDADIKLKQIESDFNAKMAEIDEKDRENARSFNSWIKNLLVIMLIISMIFVFVDYSYTKDNDLKHFLNNTFQFLSTLLALVFAAYYGNK